MFSMNVPWWALIIRAMVVYIVLLAFLRMSGKRQVGQMSPFDLILLLLLSDAVQNSMNGGDNSLQGGLITIATLMLLNLLVGLISFKNKKFGALVEGFPVVLVHNGVINQKALAESRISIHELKAALRAEGYINADDVHLAMHETSGHITVIPKKGRQKTEENPPA